MSIIIGGLFGVLDMTGGASDLQNGETVFMHSLTGMSWNDLQAASPGAANLIDWKFRSDGATLFTVAVLTIAAFAFLTTRAWRSRRPIVKWAAG